MKREEFERLLKRLTSAQTLEGLNSIEMPDDLSAEQRQVAMDTGHSMAMSLGHRRTPINPKQALYIKLGERGRWERQCLEEDQTLRIGWEKIDHDLCLAGRWDEVHDQLLQDAGSPGAAADWKRQLQRFYQAEDNVLWITFYNQHLWWCFSKPAVTRVEDGSRVRPAITEWSYLDLKGQPLNVDRLSGALVAIQGYRGTICHVDEAQLPYLVGKINATLPALTQATQTARDSLVREVEALVCHLHWRDFELLVALLFGKVGWNRVSPIGGSRKDVDMVLEAPITGKKYGVQVKSSAQLGMFREWESNVREIKGLERIYFVVHSPSADLEGVSTSETIEVMGPGEVAEWAVKFGLVDWIIDRALIK